MSRPHTDNNIVVFLSIQINMNHKNNKPNYVLFFFNLQYFKNM